MKLNENGLVIEICAWLKNQKEFKEKDTKDSKSIFYHIAPSQYANLILRYLNEEITNSNKGRDSIFDIVGHSNKKE